MKILHVHLECNDLEKMKAFYIRFLKMELEEEDSGSFTVKAGQSRLTFIKSENRPYYHVCFRTNERFFDLMFEKIESSLLPNEKGEVSMFWKGKQAYFHDPEGNVLEMLERKDVPADLLDWFDVIEVGLPCENIHHMQKELSFLNDQFLAESDTFAFVGDNNGAAVVVKEGRDWYPTARGSEIHPIVLEVEGEINLEYRHAEYPYTIVVKKRKKSAKLL
ncbi:VOC family protein [Bacillus sp. UMB0893]|uniref:VOC family protein n=1 Tax=Bacillus sp. UMB0893 TaxID=2066053 RepID=UPI000C7936CA|nr:VOC family protein [Bacillus sp. UMB0893]PLR69407.1 hypothetical protein CYJ36_02895 [Bacillus sp. UMB0893]